MNKIKERILANFKKNKIILLVFVVAWMVSIFLLITKYDSKLGKEPIGNNACDNVVEINKENYIESVVPVEENSESVSIMFATYARKNKGSVNVKIVGQGTKTLYVDEQVKCKSVQDNSFVTFELNNIKDKYLIVSISSDNNVDESIGVYYSNEEYFNGSRLKINDELFEGDLTLKYSIYNEGLKELCISIICWSIVGITLLILLLLLVEPKYEVLFTIIIIVFGLIMNIAITPMSSPDEQLHYENCLQLSNYVFGHKEDHIYVSQELANDSHFAGHYNTSMAYIRLIEQFNDPLKISDKLKECKTDAEGSYIVYYIPQVLAICISRLINLNMLKTFYLGRLFNLVLYVICIYFAIKNTPVHKLLFGILASTPMFIQTAVSYSYDVFIIGMCFIVASYLLKWMNTAELIETKDIVLLFIVCLLLAPAKVIYGLLILLFIFVPTSKFGSQKKKMLVIGIMFLPTFCLLMYNILIRFEDTIKNLFVVHADDGTLVPREMRFWTVRYCVQHPIEAITIIAKTIRYNIKKWFYDSIGHTLSGQTLVLPTYLTYIELIVVFLATFRKENVFYSPSMYKLFSLGVCVAIAMLVLITMLTGWTHRGDEMIIGVQGRYFCPFLPFFFTSLSNKKIRVSEKLDKYIVYVHIINFFAVIMYVLAYTFLN